jgi:hypothetical protein
MMESPGGLYEEVTERRVYLLFNHSSRTLLRKFWGHEDMFDNASEEIGINFGYHEGHYRSGERNGMFRGGARNVIRPGPSTVTAMPS